MFATEDAKEGPKAFAEKRPAGFAFSGGFGFLLTYDAGVLTQSMLPDGSFPARFLAEFFHNHGMLTFTDRPKWRTVAGGSHRYVEAITAPLVPSVVIAACIEHE